jgi:hypothetical protein
MSKWGGSISPSLSTKSKPRFSNSKAGSKKIISQPMVQKRSGEDPSGKELIIAESMKQYNADMRRLGGLKNWRSEKVAPEGTVIVHDTFYKKDKEFHPRKKITEEAKRGCTCWSLPSIVQEMWGDIYVCRNPHSTREMALWDDYWNNGTMVKGYRYIGQYTCVLDASYGNAQTLFLVEYVTPEWDYYHIPRKAFCEYHFVKESGNGRISLDTPLTEYDYPCSEVRDYLSVTYTPSSVYSGPYPATDGVDYHFPTISVECGGENTFCLTCVLGEPPPIPNWYVPG